MGRFRFDLYEALDAAGEVVCQGEAYLPKRRAREWHKTEGFREEALCLEASKRSYRDTMGHLNRYRRQWQEGTPVTTLRDNAQKEGTRVLDFLEHHSQSVLQEHGFDGQGQPNEVALEPIKAGADRRLEAGKVERALTAVCQEMAKRGFSPPEIAAVCSQGTEAVYEDPAHCTNVFIDDVDVKKQKPHRRRATTPTTEAFATSGGIDATEADVPDSSPSAVASGSGKSRPKVANTVARIEQGSKRFTLSGSGLGQVLRFVLAFLLHNQLLGGRLHIFTDGYKSLQNTIVAFFAWHPRVGLVLDWYHLVKKFKEDLSRACRARALRNQHLHPLVRFLWYGMVTEARALLQKRPVIW